ncbi:hypothetical protein OG455_27750 [Kitasatospora sp. NBC_01287]|uniref:hypothetical protein n=1 Tax=Kitasatospora sp. NBC_01287 TaxID=2903573 RepID=UPI00224CB5F3|nr:hypothetical protein [Kitasatospora sp. NBC_01287]MCX4749256.1 hypothetical protein [Kitasatospora sp. NBC_01287]
MGRALCLEHSNPAVNYFLDHYTLESVVRAMDTLGMIEDLNILDLARAAFHRAFPGRQPGEPGPGSVHAAMDLLRAVGAATPKGIPRHKLATGEGWLISPREITAALDAYQQADPEQREAIGARIDDWAPWIDFLHVAGDHHGLRSN